ncbi:LPS-assembly protein LptD [Amphritea opalescens]|uniref:LPS-assembly protein LptD n=1 Tax=Amphritea opalescens TaxID=2490544 RepID=A0A430KTH2_9GAMM|nr:LPS assembly protein LptD [Amphritea opalescens]RTE66787.1 LPS-assembly protein LptD [Amphritea opalescens]
MPFSRRSSYTLTLAIIAAAPTALMGAETDTNIRDALWTCTMENGQSWQCDHPEREDVLPPAVDPAAPTVAAESTEVDVAPVVTQVNRAKPQVNGAWLCEASATGGWACAGNEPNSPVATSKPSTAAVANTVATSDTITASPKISAPVVNPPKTTAALTESLATTVTVTSKVSTPVVRQPNKTAKQQRLEALKEQADLSDTRYASQDWYPITGASRACFGVYIEPDDEIAANDNENLTVDADSSKTELGGLTQLEGNVELRQQGHFLRSNSAEVDQVSNQITMTGDIRYREPGLLLRGAQAQTNALTGETVISDADYIVHEQSLRGEAKRIIRLQDNRIRMEKSSYTTCSPSDESWQISSDSLVLDPNKGFGTARHATLEVAGTPVFYFPYLEFPIDDLRHSGFLFPSFGYSNDDGLEIATPYYFNLAPDYDDTLTPKIYTERGLLLENEFRHMNSYGQQALSTGLMFDDNEADRDRWLVGIDHTGYKGAWSSQIDFNAVSDDDYFDDLGSSLEVDRSNHLNRLAEATYSQQNWEATLRAHSYQTINDSDSPYQKMPQLQVKGSYSYDLGQEVVLSYLTDATQFDRDIEDLTGIDRVTGTRFHVQPSISVPMISSWGYLTPKLSYWLSQYELEDQIAGEDDSISRATGVFSIDSGLLFERQAGDYTQTLEPRLFALYSEKEDQQGIPDFDTAEADFSYEGLFRENRFTGLDKVSDNQQITAGIGSGFYREDGSEMAHVGLAQAYYFADRTVQLNGDTSVDTEEQSNFAAEVYWNPYSKLRFSMDTELDRNDLSPLESNFKVRYTPAINKVINLSYRYREDVRDQVEMSFIWPLSPEWTAMVRWQEDMENSQTPEALLGLEYANCCWKVRVAARQWIEDDSDGQEDTALFLQFILKGLGAIGNGSNALQDIVGFQEREENDDY